MSAVLRHYSVWQACNRQISHRILHRPCRSRSETFRSIVNGREISTGSCVIHHVRKYSVQKEDRKDAIIRKEVRENIYTIPNLLTVSRILATPGIGYLIYTGQHIPAVSLLFVAGLTDVVDGYIARKYDMGSVVGTILDPFADKFLMTTLVVTLSMSGQMPIWLATIILGRDVGLLISALYWRYISLPPPKTFSRFWDFSLPSAQVNPTRLSKINTGLQLALVGIYTVDPLLMGYGLNVHGLLGLEGFSYLVAATTTWTGLNYIWDKNAVKILRSDEK